MFVVVGGVYICLEQLWRVLPVDKSNSSQQRIEEVQKATAATTTKYYEISIDDDMER